MKESHGKSSTAPLTSVVGSATFFSMARAYKEDTEREKETSEGWLGHAHLN